MEATTIIGGMAIAGAAAAGLRLGAGLIPIGLQAYRDLKQLKNSPAYRLREESRARQAARSALARPEGLRRDSSIVGIYEDCVRHKDGAYTRIYEILLEASMFAKETEIERRCDDFARTLCAELPAGMMAQVRYRVDRDQGRAIAEHFRERRYENIYLPAAYLHDSNLEFLQGKAARGFYRYERALLVLRFPAAHPADGQSRGMSAYLPDLCGQLSRGGVRSFLQALKGAPSHPAFRGVVDRIRSHEAEAFREADIVMRRLEMEFPVRLRQLTGRELWEVLYQSHNLGARAVPNVTIRPGDDLRDYLCGETIEYCGWYVMHGNTPLTIISMHAPPDGGIYADSSRLLTARADLAFPHTICTEYIALDPAAAKKQLMNRAKLVEQDLKKADGRARRDYDARAALADIEDMLAHIAASREALVQCRCYALVQGDPVKNLAELKESLSVLEQRAEILESALKRIEGADVRREEPESIRCLYQGMLLGEMSPEPTGREMQEVAHSLAALAPLETAWQGSPRSHTVFGTVSGRLTRANFFRVTSPLMTVYGVPGAGKSVQLGALIVDALATMPGCRVHAVDIGGSLAPLAEALDARYFRLTPDDKRTLNIFDSPELAGGETPGEETIALILMHMMTLAKVKDDNERAPIVLTKAIKSVLKNFVPRNGPGLEKREPTLKHLVAKLRAYQFENDRDKACAEDLASALDVHVGDPWLDAPTHPDFDTWSPFDVYEMDSLEKFPQLVRQALAGVIATRVIRSIGKKNEDGEYTPTLLVFDEAHRYSGEFPGIMKVIARGARQGRKANVLTCVLTHTYDDFEGIHDITATAGIRLIGLQTGNISRLVADAQLSDRAVAAVNAIRNVAGSHAQFVLQIGSGASQEVEMIQVELSPILLWTCTTNPLEHNARQRVRRLTGCSMMQAVAWLAMRYPRGLVLEGLQEIDEGLLKP